MPERPIECCHCENKISILYKTLVKGQIETVQMCQNCPLLKKKLLERELFIKNKAAQLNEISCPSCGLDLSSLKQGENLGCSECYKVFADILIEELSQKNHLPIPLNIQSTKSKQTPIHVGRSPPQNTEKGTLSARLETLHVALGEALAFENYEGAASLRDQIKELMERNHEKS